MASTSSLRRVGTASKAIQRIPYIKGRIGPSKFQVNGFEIAACSAEQTNAQMQIKSTWRLNSFVKYIFKIMLNNIYDLFRSSFDADTNPWHSPCAVITSCWKVLPLAMEEWILDDLLECSVCLERLDTSSKVLPCQHTFCKKCLEEISRTHNELRCPECRILVETSIDGLPPNVLLMRILEGIRNVAPDHPASKQSPSGKPAEPHPTSNARSPHVEKPNNSNKVYAQPCAKAIYDYSSYEPG